MTCKNLIQFSNKPLKDDDVDFEMCAVGRLKFLMFIFSLTLEKVVTGYIFDSQSSLKLGLNHLVVLIFERFSHFDLRLIGIPN